MASSIRTSVGPDERAEVAELAGLPLAEVVASPFALRMVALGVSVGSTTLHQELRAQLGGPRTRAAADPDHGRYRDGFLHAGKYEQFGLEDPHAAFHPSHTSKWGPHELMHRAVGFFHRPRPTRFELYLGARLNELVPVVTWYGPEQAMRLREGRFDRARAGREPEAAIDDARWLGAHRPGAATLELAGSLLREGLEHFERELAAIDREILTGRTITVPHAFLDASSDAVGYVLGHADYLRSDEAADVLGRFARVGVERFDRIETYRDHVEATFDRLLFEPIALSPDSARNERFARDVWDRAQRAARRGPSTYRRFGRLIDDADALAARARAGSSVSIDDLDARVAECLGDRAEVVLAVGDRTRPRGVDRVQLRAMLEATCASAVDLVDPESLADALVASEHLCARASLPTRVARFASALGDDRLADLARFDAAIARASREDRVAEALADDASVEPGFVILTSGFEPLALGHDVLSGPPFRKRASAMLVGRHRGSIAVVPIPPKLLAVVARLAAAPMRERDLIDAIRSATRASAARATEIESALVAAGAATRRSIRGAR